MRSATFIGMAAIAAAAAAGCSETRAQSGGPLVDRQYQVGGFTQIEVAGPYDVDVRTGSNFSVSARGSESLLQRTIVEVEGDRLVIRPEKDKWWRSMSWGRDTKANFVVTLPQIRGATIAGSGDVRVNEIRGDQFEGTIAGSGALNLGSLDVQQLKLSIAGSGEARASRGRAARAEYDIAGSGDVDASAIHAQDVHVSIAGSGDVRAHATGVADVDIVGSGDVTLTGGARCSVSKAGSGNVRCS
jgi:hypothetical protein